MGAYLYIDGFSVNSTGKFASAISKGLVRDYLRAYQSHTFDNTWNVDYGKLAKACGVSDIKKVSLYNTDIDKRDTIYTFKDTDVLCTPCTGHEAYNCNRMIIDVIVDLYENILPAKDKSEIILVTRNFALDVLTKFVLSRNVSCSVMFWDFVPNTFKDETTRFICLDDKIDTIRLR